MKYAFLGGNLSLLTDLNIPVVVSVIEIEYGNHFHIA